MRMKPFARVALLGALAALMLTACAEAEVTADTAPPQTINPTATGILGGVQIDVHQAVG